MNSGIRRRSRTFGLAASIAGLLALLAVAIPQWVAPLPEIPVETHFSVKQRIAEKLKRIGRKHERYAEPAGWEERLPIATIFLALLTVVLAVVSVVRGEEPLLAGVAVALGIGAIGLQLTILFAVGVAAMLLLYAALGEPDGAVSLAIIAICAIIVLAIMGALGMGLFSAFLLICVAGALLGINVLRGGS
jgi:hypothetical protein